MSKLFIFFGNDSEITYLSYPNDFSSFNIIPPFLFLLVITLDLRYCVQFKINYSTLMPNFG